VTNWLYLAKGMGNFFDNMAIQTGIYMLSIAIVDPIIYHDTN